MVLDEKFRNHLRTEKRVVYMPKCKTFTSDFMTAHPLVVDTSHLMRLSDTKDTQDHQSLEDSSTGDHESLYMPIQHIVVETFHSGPKMMDRLNLAMNYRSSWREKNKRRNWSSCKSLLLVHVRSATQREQVHSVHSWLVNSTWLFVVNTATTQPVCTQLKLLCCELHSKLSVLKLGF